MIAIHPILKRAGLTLLIVGTIGWVHAASVQHSISKGNSIATRKPSSSAVDLVRTYCEKTESLNILVTPSPGHPGICVEEVKCTWADPAFIKAMGGASKLPANENSSRVQHDVVDSVYCAANTDGTCPTIKECIETSITARVMMTPSGQVWRSASPVSNEK